MNGVRNMYPRSICGTDCCENCGRKEECGGCIETKGHPFGGACTAAEYIKREGLDAFRKFKEKLVQEFNSLGIKHLHVNDLNLLNGFYVNLEYLLPNGQTVKLLEGNKIYLGNQIEIPGTNRCYGIVADEDYLLVCEYGCGGADPQIIVYKETRCQRPLTAQKHGKNRDLFRKKIIKKS